MPEETALAETNQDIEGTRISFLSPDFILILTFALLVDALDLPLFIIKLLTGYVPGHLISMIADAVTFLVITFWMTIRMSGLNKAKEEQADSLIRLGESYKKRTIAKQRLAGMSKKAVRRATRRAFSKSALRTAVKRGLAGMTLEFIPLVCLLPFWTITVLLTLRKK
jgi:hypothetical protein